MMAFSIRFVEKGNSYLALDEGLMVGQIEIDSFKEFFESSMSYWNKEQYIDQWKNGLKRIIGGYNESCLITSIYDPSHSIFLFWWSLFRLENTVIFQNQLLFVKDLKGLFDPSNPYQHIKKREIADDEGRQISEWEISITEIELFLSSL
jgi:hypothetical protein